MGRISRQVILTLILFLTPGLALAMVVNGGVISGLPPNTLIEVDLGLAQPATARTNADGEVAIKDEDDGDPNGLYIPPGNDGEFQVRVKDTGALLGALLVAGPSITAASSIGAPTSDYNAYRTFVSGEFQWYEQGDLDTSVANGAALARNDGFAVRSDADEDGFGGGIGFGVALGDGNPWHSAGSLQWIFELIYTWYEDRDGKFTATAPGVTLRSSGTQELEELRTSIGVRYHVADNVGIEVGAGYSWYDYEDSGALVRIETGGRLNAFSESNDDDSANIHVALTFQVNDDLGLSFGYRQDIDETGANDDSEVEEFFATVRYGF